MGVTRSHAVRLALLESEPGEGSPHTAANDVRRPLERRRIGDLPGSPVVHAVQEVAESVDQDATPGHPPEVDAGRRDDAHEVGPTPPLLGLGRPRRNGATDRADPHTGVLAHDLAQGVGRRGEVPVGVGRGSDPVGKVDVVEPRLEPPVVVVRLVEGLVVGSLVTLVAGDAPRVRLPGREGCRGQVGVLPGLVWVPRGRRRDAGAVAVGRPRPDTPDGRVEDGPRLGLRLPGRRPRRSLPGVRVECGVTVTEVVVSDAVVPGEVV